MNKIKSLESAINNLKEVELGIAEMSHITGGKCLFFGRFMLPNGCVCDKKNFLAIGETGTDDSEES